MSSYQHHPAPSSTGAAAGAGQDASSLTSGSPVQPSPTTAGTAYHQAHHYDNGGLVSPSAQNMPMAHSQGQFPITGLQALSQALNPVAGDASPPNAGASRYGVPAAAAISQNHQGQDGQPSATNGTPSTAQATSPAKPQTRLRRACDMCSQRKVKCDESTPCRPCSDLGVDCTFARAQRRRGPPNKHAEAFRAAKRSRTEPESMPSQHAAPEMPVSVSPVNGEAMGILDAETIAPFPVLELLIDDYYTYIHPLIPFPHQPTFRASFVNREDKTNPEFLGLLASMMGCLVASFPRAARLHLKAQHGDRQYPRSIDFVEHCRAVVLASRGHRFMEKEQVSVSDAMTSYFIGLSAGYTMRWNLCRRFMAEALSFVRELGFHRAGRVSPTARALGINRFPVNEKGFVEEEMGKRVFWVLFLGIRSMSQLGASHSEVVLPPETPPEYYPELPREVDDECITHDRILPQPDGIVSLMVGFNKAIQIYMTMQSLVGYELHYGLTTLEWGLQMNILDAALTSVKPLVEPENLPEDLRVQLIPSAATVASVWDQAPGFGYVAPAFPNPQPSHDIRLFWDREPGKKRLLQYEIQKTNIYTSWLATRSFYVERFLTLRDERRHAARQSAQQSQISIYRMPPDTSHIAAAAIQGMEPEPDTILGLKFEAERESVVQDLMTVLMSIPQRNMEPNGASLINKIRQVASTLLNDAPTRKGPVAQKNEAYLAHFLHILTRLEKTGPPASAQGSDHHSDEPMTAEDEEEELRSWADLRDYQEAFIRSGGFARG